MVSPATISSHEQLAEIYRYAGSIILKIVYGYDTLEENDPMIAVVQEGIACLEEATKPGYLIDLFPWCKFPSVCYCLFFLCLLLSC